MTVQQEASLSKHSLPSKFPVILQGLEVADFLEKLASLSREKVERLPRATGC